MMTQRDAVEKAYDLYSGAQLGNQPRNKRLVLVGAALLPDPSASLPQAIRDRHQTDLAYEFLSNRNVTPQGINAAMYLRTLERSKSRDEVLLISDSTEFDYSSHKNTRGLGHIG